MKGFTLIELLVVVLIIGILASIALPQYETVVEKSRATEALVNVKAIVDAMQRHIQEFPDHETVGVSNCTQIADVQLKGGRWQVGCSSSSGTPSSTCTADTQNAFRTKNFCYDISGSNIQISRIDKGGSTLYTVNYTKPTSDGDSTAEETCPEQFKQVCKLFTDL